MTQIADNSDWCPICGKKGAQYLIGHHCPERTLAGINGADTRASNAEADPPFLVRPIGERLARGFWLLEKESEGVYWEHGDDVGG